MTPLGDFVVRAELGEVAAFRAATGLPPADAVPMTFPMRWLAMPEVRDTLLAMAAEPYLVPVHESQSFEYLAPLRAERDYAMSLEGRREATPDRLVVQATVADDNNILVRMETILRLFSAAPVAA